MDRTMKAQRGTRHEDVLSQRIWTPRDLEDVGGEVCHLTYLALLLFLSRHADPRAYVYVREESHGGHEGRKDERRGNG